MTRNDFRILCTALGFTAVILNNENPDNQAVRAKSIARLIESFCLVTEPQSFGMESRNITGENNLAVLDHIIENYKHDLQSEGSARLPSDRALLVAMLDRLLLRQCRSKHKEFYAQGSDDMIANRILHLAEEEIHNQEANA